MGCPPAPLVDIHLLPPTTLGSFHDTVCRCGGQTVFHFDNLFDRTVAFMEKPLRTTLRIFLVELDSKLMSNTVLNAFCLEFRLWKPSQKISCDSLPPHCDWLMSVRPRQPPGGLQGGWKDKPMALSRLFEKGFSLFERPLFIRQLLFKRSLLKTQIVFIIWFGGLCPPQI
ncbi:unnamed protein product [Hymenolepis diminuta]|uniref:Uncharacterized protein n=1 Tax=Hymenolepis diminuta TaxID=6216 RepID=A0A0R3S7J0_HYMDI|nr:unnamed protein product [Hymenolepis diminuta]